MLRTALASIFLSVVIYLLGRAGWTGVSIELGRIFVVVFLTLSALVVGVQLVVGRHHGDVL